MVTPLLEVKEVSRNFGGLQALTDVSFKVNKGEIVGLIGPNGAGKTTLFNAITGVFPPTNGRILLEGEDITGLKLYKVALKGIVRTFQADVLFREFTALENVLVGLHMRAKSLNPKEIMLSRRSIPESEKSIAREILNTVGLTRFEEVMAGDLPHGYQRMLGIGVALAAQPKLLLLDEPVTGMNLDEITQVTDIINNLQEKGLTILLVEHHIKTVMDICRQMVVLNFGKKIAEGTPEEIRRDKNVIEAYLGPDTA